MTFSKVCMNEKTFDTLKENQESINEFKAGVREVTEFANKLKKKIKGDILVGGSIISNNNLKYTFNLKATRLLKIKGYAIV